MTKTIQKIALAGALALGAALPASAVTMLNGDFTVYVSNYDASGSSGNAAATQANMDSYGVDDVFTYSGALNFNVDNVPADLDLETIADFLATGGGTVSGLDAAVGALRLSTPTFRTTTVFKFVANFVNDFTGNIRHDDGITFIDNGSIEVNAAAPTAVTNHGYDFSGGQFTLIYAAANGNPSILQVTGEGIPAPIPLPAGGVLLLTALGGLAAARRRKSA